MKKHFATIQILILFILLTLAAVAGAYFFWQAIQRENRQIFAVGKEIATETAQEKQADSLQGLLQDTAASRATLDATILPSNGFVPFVESIEAIGQSQGVDMTDSLSTIPDNSAYIKVPLSFSTEFLSVQVTLSGTWDAVVRTISLIETEPYTLSIDSLALNKDLKSSTASKSIWDASFTLNVEERTQ